MDIIQALKEELQIGRNQVEAAVKLIDEGNTIPFIARYRKEATGSLNDEVLRQLDERLRYLRNLEDKKEQVIGAIRAQEKLTPALEKQIRDAATLVAVEDLYLPYRPKRRTRAGIAREKGLEPLAVWIYKQEAGGSLEAEAAKYVSEEKGVADVSEAIDGARDGRSDSGQLPPPDRTGHLARDPRKADRNGRERRDSGIWQEPGTAPDAAADRRMRGARLGSGIPDGLQAGSCG